MTQFTLPLDIESLEITKQSFDTKGNIIATVGIGRDITYEIEQINKAIDTPQLEDIKGILISLLNHYKFTDRS